MIKKLVFTLALIYLTACSHTPTQPLRNVVQQPSDPTGVITCINRQDASLDFRFRSEDTARWYSEQYDVYIYLIDTIDGKQLAINSLELENYVCNVPDAINSGSD